MRLTRSMLRRMILEAASRSQLSLVLEAEEDDKEKPKDDATGDDTGSDDLFGDSGGDEEKTDEEGDSDSADDAASDDSEDSQEEEDKGAENTVPKEEVEEREEDAREEGARDALEVEKTIGKPIALAVQGAFDDAVAAFDRVKDIALSEGLSRVAWGRSRGVLSRLLFEDQRPEIDMAMYCQRIANLITNYDSILDIEKAIFDAAYSMLSGNDDFGPDVADEFRDILARDYDLEFDHVYDPEKADQPVYAAGSRKPEGA